MRFTVLAIVMSVVIGGNESTARAFDLTGTWQGTQTCEFISGGIKYPETFTNDVLDITQSGSQIRLHERVDRMLYKGLIFPVATDRNRAQVSFRLCGTTDNPTTGGEM